MRPPPNEPGQVGARESATADRRPRTDRPYTTMATTYQTIPAEPATAPEKSRKGVVFRTAAAFFLGVVAATAVSTASKPTASTAFGDAALHTTSLCASMVEEAIVEIRADLVDEWTKAGRC